MHWLTFDPGQCRVLLLVLDKTETSKLTPKRALLRPSKLIINLKCYMKYRKMKL
jgi:hypothetical protein